MNQPRNQSSTIIKRHLSHGFLLREKFRIDELIGRGGFGQIYRAEDFEFHLVVAVKVGLCSLEPARMVLERRVLHLLTGTPHSPALLASETFGRFMYIVMELLGRNLMDLRRRYPLRHFSVATTLRCGRQGVDALRAIHTAAFLHRDVKPSNICVGAEGAKRRVLYVVDFGMARHFRDADGRIRRERRYAGFRGTTRYVSITAHNRQEQGPVDDLWSLFYSVVELGEVALPWRLVADAAEVRRLKLETRVEAMCQNLPAGLSEFAQQLDPLHYDDMPDYDRLNGILTKLMPSNVGEDTPYDWE